MSSVIALPFLPSTLAACIVLAVGGLLGQRVGLLSRFSIPAPIIGGLLFAALALLAKHSVGFEFTIDTAAKLPLLLIFFAMIGLTADLALLRSGGARLARFLLALFPFLVLQDLLGVAMAYLLGLHPILGLITGSITLVGGHGTGAAYAQRFAEEHDILGLMGLTMTSATLGLVIGGIIGGPVAEHLIRRLRHVNTSVPPHGGVIGGPVSMPVTMLSFTVSLGAALAAVFGGQAIGELFQDSGITVPDFLWCLITGLIIRNGGSALGVRLHDAASELIGSVCLSIFLAWTMMTLDLGSVIATGGPLLLILAAQTVLVAVWAGYAVFRIVGRDYEAAIISGAFCGFAMGATATAIANMQALVSRHGPAPQAFVVVPLVGAFFIDLMNLAVLTVFLLPGFIVG